MCVVVLYSEFVVTIMCSLASILRLRAGCNKYMVWGLIAALVLLLPGNVNDLVPIVDVADLAAATGWPHWHTTATWLQLRSTPTYRLLYQYLRYALLPLLIALTFPQFRQRVGRKAIAKEGARAAAEKR